MDSNIEASPAPSVLAVSNLTVSYEVKGRAQQALREASLTVPSTGILAIVGESGSGKSTLAHAIVGLLPDNALVSAGTIRLGELELVGLPERRMRQVRGSRIGFVPQDPMMSLNPTMKIGPQVAEAITLHEEVEARELRSRVRQLLVDAGLKNPDWVIERYPHELSGGMRQRALIAMAFACSPDMIIADEPTSALDATVSAKVLDHLQSLVTERGTSLIIITHDLAVAARRATDVVVMSAGRVEESGLAADVFANPRADYTKRLLGSSLQLRPRRPRNFSDVTDSTGGDAGPAVVVEHLTKQFGDGNVAVDGVSFEVPAGRTFALVGESGSGKSTTVRMILGLESITSGSVNVFGADIGGLRGHQVRDLFRRMQVVYQSPYGSLDPRFSVRRIIGEPLRSFGIGDAASRRGRVRELMERVGLPDSFLKRRPAELSGGQRQRVAIARALAVSPELIVLDEPVSALDASIQSQILDLLVEIQRDTGVTYIFISHDLAVVADIAHVVGVMRAGRLLEVRPSAELFAAPRDPYTRDLLDSAFVSPVGAVN